MNIRPITSAPRALAFAGHKEQEVVTKTTRTVDSELEELDELGKLFKLQEQHVIGVKSGDNNTTILSLGSFRQDPEIRKVTIPCRLLPSTQPIIIESIHNFGDTSIKQRFILAWGTATTEVVRRKANEAIEYLLAVARRTSKISIHT